jgi:aspartyl-tRNA(Asn)/glutamyl-tRNA(Gln) amidotransferase subunit A
MLQGFRSLYHATAVQRLLDEGAIVIGSCNCDEFAMGSSNEHSVYGPVRNAANPLRVPGGSSGGSAVAVQAGLCMLSLGSDTGGSVRQPAGFCGVIGVKPGYGSVSRHGLVAYASSFDQIGVMGTVMDDIALALQVISGPDAFDSTLRQHPPEPLVEQGPNPGLLKPNPGRPFRFAYIREAVNHPSLDPEIGNAMQDCFSKLKKAGHQVEAVSLPLLDLAVPAYYVLTTAEASTNLSRYDGVRYGYRSNRSASSTEALYAHSRSEGFGGEVKRRILLGTFVLGAGYQEAYFTRAQQIRRMISDSIRELFNRCDALLLPTSPTTAFLIGEKPDNPTTRYLADIYTVPANLAGIPALSLPLFHHSDGMPFGLQVMTKAKDELTLLQAGKRIIELYRTAS